MKDGAVAEAGTHEELMSKDGEYAKLYNIQAEAFSSIPSTETPETKSLEEVSHVKVQTRECRTNPNAQINSECLVSNCGCGVAIPPLT